MIEYGRKRKKTEFARGGSSVLNLFVEITKTEVKEKMKYVSRIKIVFYERRNSGD